MITDKIHVWLSIPLILTLLPTLNASALERPNACDASDITYVKPPRFTKEEKGKTHISADQSQILKDGISRFSGNVIIEQDQVRLRADNADYDEPTDRVTLSGNIHADTANISIDADQATLSLKDDSSSFASVEFYIPESKLRGSASKVKTEKKDFSHLDKTLITSCPRSQIDWYLKADTIDIDHTEEYGSANGAIIAFKDVPFFYLPYIEFPVGNKRRSGVLVPELSDSNSRGTEFALPWYWNIAPNQDAVLTPRYMSRRGIGLDANYRFLTHTSNGVLNASFLPDDEIANDSRHYIHYVQTTDINERTNLSINLNEVSDIDYNNDFNNIVTDGNLAYLDREIALNYFGDYWQANLLTHTIEPLNQSLTIANRPYRRLPQLTVGADIPLNESGLSAFFNTEAVIFDHEDLSKTTGNRLSITPGLKYQLAGSAWHFIPSVEISHTQYDVKDGSGTPIDVDERTLPITSVDTGLYFERNTASGYLQTLEPRLYYLNIPFEDQSGIPIFDTNINQLTINQLFRPNRFNGRDLIGDANQISLSLGSRLIDPNTGRELLSANIGQIYYFSDRKVSLPSGSVDKANTSDIIADATLNIDRWNATATLQWDSEYSEVERENLSLQYRSDKNNLVNLSYRLSQNPATGITRLKHVDTSFYLPINGEVSLIGRWNYSLKDERDISVVAGIAYDSCCWSMTLLGQRYLLNDQNQEYDSAIMLQMIFKEFGSVSGNHVRNTLISALPGYTEEY